MVPRPNVVKQSPLNEMTWYDRCLLFSPKTWWGVMHQLQDSPFTEFHIKSVVQSLLALAVPLYIVLLSQLLPWHISLLSPWSLAHLHRGVVHPVQQLVQTAESWHRGRKDALPCARDCLQERIDAKTCIPCGRYNVFLPTKIEEDEEEDVEGAEQQQQQRVCHVLLWIPGALIDHTAYSQVAAKLADLGVCVVTLSMEPCRMATTRLGADLRRLLKVQSHVKTLLPTTKKLLWSVGGHSLGSFAAMAVAPHFDACIMWASANFLNTRTDLSSYKHLPILVLQGSNDALCRMDDASFAEFTKDFPQRTTVCANVIGAAHSWFASIEPGDPKFVGTSSITMEQQQDAAAKKTYKFLKEQVEGAAARQVVQLSEQRQRQQRQ